LFFFPAYEVCGRKSKYSSVQGTTARASTARDFLSVSSPGTISCFAFVPLVTGKGIITKGVMKVASINIYVGNLSFQTSEDQLKELFESYGQVESATIISDKTTGRPRGFGFVKMPEREDGLKAIQELDSRDFMGRSLKVNEARPKTDRPGGGGGGGGRQGFGAGRNQRWG
jgi:hypothetical protein